MPEAPEVTQKPRVVLVEPRVIRRVIRAHRIIAGFGLAVPHARCYGLGKKDAIALLRATELPCAPSDLTEWVVLVQKPASELAPALQAREVWRATFHALVHLELDARRAESALSSAAIKKRVNQIGQTEFDEIRTALRQDDLLLPQADDIDTWIEFVATYAELRAFAASAARKVFPTLRDVTAVDALVALDVDVSVLVERARPDGVEGAAAAPDESVAEIDAHAEEAHVRIGGSARQARGRVQSKEELEALGESAKHAGALGNHVREAVEHLERARTLEGQSAADCRAAADRALAALARSLLHATRTEKESAAATEETDAKAVAHWLPILHELALHAAEGGLGLMSVEARLLYDLQRAVLDYGRPRKIVDVVGFVTSFGSRSVVRELDAERPVRVVRHLRAAVAKIERLELPEKNRAHLVEHLRETLETAEGTLRGTLRPRVTAAFDALGAALMPKTAVERAARDKLIGELLDHVLEHGRFDLGVLRDAVSRNQLKIDDLRIAELFVGDALLRLDRELAVRLDGVYRGGEIYMRFLQKVSSLFFGTFVGRLLTLWLLLPVLSSFVALEGFTHVLHAFGLHHLHLGEPRNIVIGAVFILANIQSVAVRKVTFQALRMLGIALAWIFFRGPIWIFSQPPMQALLSSTPVRLFQRHLLSPTLVLLPVWWLLHRWAHTHRHASERFVVGCVGGLFLLYNIAASSSQYQQAEEIVADWSSQQWKHLHRQVLPGLFRIVMDFFRWALEQVERGLYAVDEMLRFRPGERASTQAFKGVAGFIWFFFSYTVRLYVNLMIEPQFNPIKHFPVVTVAAKIIFPMAGVIFPALVKMFMALGLPPHLARQIAGFNFFVLPGFAGFLVWELKENWKLYRATRPKTLQPVPIGHHGETMGRLLKPGIHSGTIPKLYAKVRRAVHKGDPKWIEHRVELDHVAEAVRHFVGRELTALLAQSSRWTLGRVQVSAVEIASNRVRVQLDLERAGKRDPEGTPSSAVLHFEEQSGWLVASVAEQGFIADLAGEDHAAMEAALAGIYAKAGVDIVREDLVDTIGKGVPYDVADEGLVVWPREDFAGEVVYPLEGEGESKPEIHGESCAAPVPSLVLSQVRIADRAIDWNAWCASWEGTPRADRLVSGPDLLAVA